MSGIVVDASIAVNWLLDEEWNAVAEWTLGKMEAGVAISVPSIWVLEITHVLFKAERRKLISKIKRNEALDEVEKLNLKVFPAPTLMDLKTLRTYMEKYQLSAYDADYLRVAKEHKLTLASLDGNLLAAAKRENVSVADPK